MTKKLYYICFSAYAVLLVLAIIFYKERTIFTDISYHLFYILKDNGFAVQNFRYGAIATQLFPRIGLWLGMDLNGIMMLYSCGFILYYALCYIICGVVLKNYKIALASLLVTILFSSHTFYWIQSELPQGLAFLMVSLAFLSRIDLNQVKAVPLALFFFCITTLVFFHPVLVFPFMFSSMYYLLHKQEVINKKLLFAAIVFYMLIYVLKKYIFITGYDNNAMEGINRIFDSNFFLLYSHEQFLLNCLDKYYWIPIMSIGICTVYISKKNWKKLGLFLFFFIVYLSIVNISYQDPSVRAFYIENLYLPLGVFIAIPFVYDVLPLFDAKPAYQYLIMALVIVTAAFRMYSTHDIYTTRLNWQRQFLKQHPNEKLLVAENNEIKEVLLMSWGTPYEFWLLSTTEQKATACIIINERVEELFWGMGNNNLLTTWGSFPYQQLPAKYFIFRDSVSNYKVIK